MNRERKDRETGCALGDLVEALYDEVAELPLRDQAKESLVAIMLGDIMHHEGREIIFMANLLKNNHMEAAFIWPGNSCSGFLMGAGGDGPNDIKARSQHAFVSRKWKERIRIK